MSKKIGVFVAWPYANGELHLGHIAGAYLPADIFARYHRLRGNSVLMVSGSDTHGTPITLKAREENSTPWEIVKRYHRTFLKGWVDLGISFNLFTHTHTQNHQQISQGFFSKLLANGDLLIRTEQQFYDNEASMFLPDRYVGGVCPRCGYERARGDQCENCGATFSAVELLNPVSRVSNSVPVLKETEHYYFDIGRYRNQLRDYVSRQSHWRTAVKNFTEAMIEDGLEPRPITRDIDWGIPVPVAGWESKVLYVWFDAVIGYFSGSVEWSIRSGQDSKWQEWWKDPQAQSYYFIGKDNVPFHTVIWPAELMGYDQSLNLPYDVPANQFLNIDGEKFSTSRGMAVWLGDMLKNFHPDAIRYYLASIFPETKDSNFSWEEFVAKNNGELLAAWGNLVNRVFGFISSRFDGKVPEPLALDSLDEQLLANMESGLVKVGQMLEGVNLREGLREAMRLVREVNKYLDEKAPWTVFKQDVARAGTSLYVALRAIDTLKVMLAPFLPFSSAVVHSALGYTDPLFGESVIETDSKEDYQFLSYQPSKEEIAKIDSWRPSTLAPGTTVKKTPPLYSLLDLESILGQGPKT